MLRLIKCNLSNLKFNNVMRIPCKTYHWVKVTMSHSRTVGLDIQKKKNRLDVKVQAILFLSFQQSFRKDGLIMMIRKILAMSRYSRFVKGKRPIQIVVHNDMFALRCNIGTSRLLRIGDRSFISIFDKVSSDDTGNPDGYYHIEYSKQYVSFSSYCQFYGTDNERMKITI